MTDNADTISKLEQVEIVKDRILAKYGGDTAAEREKFLTVYSVTWTENHLPRDERPLPPDAPNRHEIKNVIEFYKTTFDSLENLSKYFDEDSNKRKRHDSLRHELCISSYIMEEYEKIKADLAVLQRDMVGPVPVGPAPSLGGLSIQPLPIPGTTRPGSNQ
jgi:hypothetical protein